MKINELMVGDWVSYKKVCSRIAPADFDLNHRTWIQEIEPIPLTVEILEKNGWKYEQFGRRQEWWLDKTRFPIVRYSTNDTLHHNELILEFVHQLQHALKLCGINKEIEL